MGLKDKNFDKIFINKILKVNEDNSKGFKFQRVLKIQNHIEDIILNDFNENSLELNKIIIGISVFKGLKFKPELVFNISNLEISTQLCKSSSHIPLITGNLINRFNGYLVLDGAYTNLPLSLIEKPYFNINTDIWGTKLTNAFSPDKDIKFLFYKGYFDTHKNRKILNKKFKKKKKNINF